MLENPVWKLHWSLLSFISDLKITYCIFLISLLCSLLPWRIFATEIKLFEKNIFCFYLHCVSCCHLLQEMINHFWHSVCHWKYQIKTKHLVCAFKINENAETFKTKYRLTEITITEIRNNVYQARNHITGRSPVMSSRFLRADNNFFLNYTCEKWMWSTVVCIWKNTKERKGTG